MTKTLFDLSLAVSQRLGETHESKATEWTNARRKLGELVAWDENLYKTI